MLDDPGLDDNKMLISNREITDKIFLNMAKNGIQNAYIALYHSLDKPNTDIK
jgi:hypothetical protein